MNYFLNLFRILDKWNFICCSHESMLNKMSFILVFFLAFLLLCCFLPFLFLFPISNNSQSFMGMADSGLILWLFIVCNYLNICNRSKRWSRMYEKNSINFQVQGNYEFLCIQAWAWGRCSEVHGELLCLFQERLDAFLRFGKMEKTKGLKESSLYPTPCDFTPKIYFLDLKEKPSSDTLLKWDRMHWRRHKERGSRDLKISIGLLYLILRPIMVLLLYERARKGVETCCTRMAVT